MTWLATLRGDLSHLSAEAAEAEERRLAEALHEIGATLVEHGSQGVFGTFQGSRAGTLNLLDLDAPPNFGAPPLGGEVATGAVAGSTPAGTAVTPPPAYVPPGAVGEVATGAAQPAPHPGATEPATPLQQPEIGAPPLPPPGEQTPQT